MVALGHSYILCLNVKDSAKQKQGEQTKQHCCTEVMVQICKHNKGDFWIVKDNLFSLCLWSLLALCAPAEALLHYECNGRSAALRSHHTVKT